VVLSGLPLPPKVSLHMAPAAPAPEDLYARLRALYPGLSEEKVARELDIGIKTLQRLKQGHGTEYATTIALLDAVGLLSDDGEVTTRAELRRLKRALQGLVQEAEEIAEKLPP
jgi:hypothetical protein